MAARTIYLWQRLPSLRLLIPLVIGIAIQTYAPLHLNLIIVVAVCCGFILSTYVFLADAWKFKFAPFSGLAIQLAIVILGAWLTHINDVRNHQLWFGKKHQQGDYLLVNLLEPPVEKPKTYKALARVHSLIRGEQVVPARGQILIYFKKDSALPRLSAGSQLVLQKAPEEIRNASNPGSFDYKKFLLYKGVTHQLFLLPHDFIVQKGRLLDPFRAAIFQIRKYVVQTLQKYIGSRRESGLAEALIIGYKEDLDKNLVQSYSNTGVVHIIAISGLHLGVIYAIFLWLTGGLQSKRSLQWVRFAIIVVGIWAFAFVAGAHPSILRSAVMFSCIAFGQVVFRRSQVINTWALSAFLLLCFNPFWLWDVGFQLSYSAVLSILIFYRPIYNLIYASNKVVNYVWQLVAVSLAAQVLTSPISIYHFHQFPFLFLPANLLAVPLAFLLLIGIMILLLISPLEQIASLMGWLLQKIILLLNNYIEYLDRSPVAVWNHLSISIYQVLVVFAFITAVSYWLIQKNKRAALLAVLFFSLFIASRTMSLLQSERQSKLIVYNTPGLQAIDIIIGRNYAFIGDSTLIKDDYLRNFHLQPSRILHRIRPAALIDGNTKAFKLKERNVMIIDSVFPGVKESSHFDVLIFTGKPKLRIEELQRMCSFAQIVLDGSVPAGRRKFLRKDCDSLGVACHDVTEKGAFVMSVL